MKKVHFKSHYGFFTENMFKFLNTVYCFMWLKRFSKSCEALGEGFFHNGVYRALTGRCDDKYKKIELLRREAEFLGNAIKCYRILNKELTLGNYLTRDEKTIFDIRERVSNALPSHVRGDMERETVYMSEIRKSFIHTMHGKDVGEKRKNEMIELVHNMDMATHSESSQLAYCSMN